MIRLNLKYNGMLILVYICWILMSWSWEQLCRLVMT